MALFDLSVPVMEAATRDVAGSPPLDGEQVNQRHHPMGSPRRSGDQGQLGLDVILVIAQPVHPA